MTDDDYPPEWISEPPDPNDPRLGTVLEPWQPTNGHGAAVADLLLMYMARSTDFTEPFLNFCSYVYREKLVPQTVLAIFELYVLTAMSGQSEALAVKRLAELIQVARKAAIEEAS